MRRGTMGRLVVSGFAIRGVFRKLGHTSAEITLPAAGQAMTPQPPRARIRLTQAEFDRGETCGA